MLTRLHVKNFRLLKNVEIEFDPELPTVFIGPNASGKSTVLEVLDLLGRTADGLEYAFTAHDGIDSVRTAGVREPIEISTRWQVSDSSLEWSFVAQRTHNGGALVERESLVHDSGGAKRVLIDTDATGQRRIHREDGREINNVGGPMLTFHTFQDQTRFANVGMLRMLVSQVRVLGSIASPPSWVRANRLQPSPRDPVVIGPQPFLDRDGGGLANVLNNLANESPEAWAEIQKAFCDEFTFVKRIFFPPEAGGSKIALVFEDKRFPGRRFYGSEMSDGMIVFLCLLASVAHPDQVAIVGLDEPDAHLHPSAIRRILSVAQRRGAVRNLAIVTHSNALLDELTDPARSIRVVESSASGAVIRKLDADALAAWRKEYSVSEMRRTGLLDPSNTAYEPQG